MQAYSNAHGGARGANPPGDGREWVVLLTPDTRRMMSTLEVQAEVSAGTLSRETLVWRAGMSEWVAIARIVELDVPMARPQRPQPAQSWDAPMAHPHASGGHGHAQHQHQYRPSAPNPQLMQELVTTGAVAGIMVAVTLYLLSLGGAFAPGGGHPGASHSEAASSGATAQKSH